MTGRRVTGRRGEMVLLVLRLAQELRLRLRLRLGVLRIRLVVGRRISTGRRITGFALSTRLRHRIRPSQGDEGAPLGFVSRAGFLCPLAGALGCVFVGCGFYVLAYYVDGWEFV